MEICILFNLFSGQKVMFVDSQSPPQLAVPVVKATGRAKVVFLNSMYIFFIVLRNAVCFFK